MIVAEASGVGLYARRGWRWVGGRRKVTRTWSARELVGRSLLEELVGEAAGK